MAANKRLPLPDVPDVAVFRAIERILKADPLVSTVVADWRTGEGKQSDTQPFAPGKVGVRMLLIPGPESFFSPEAMENDIYVMIDLNVPGTCADDVHNLWGAIRRAIYPNDNREALRAVVEILKANGAQTGMTQFSAPAVDPSPQPGAAGHFSARGSLKIRVWDRLVTPAS